MKPLYKETFNSTDAVTLKEYLCTKVCELEDKIDLQFKMNRIALDKAETATNIRLEGLNEWRTQNKDERNTYLTKSEYDVRHENLVNKIDNLQKIVYLGLGVVMAIEFAFQYLIK